MADDPIEEEHIKMDESKVACWTCGDEGSSLQFCSVCYKATYCSKECQKKDNEGHKAWCRPWLRYKGFVKHFVPKNYGDNDQYMAPWMDYSKEVIVTREGTNPATPDAEQEEEEQSIGSCTFVYESDEDMKTLGDLIKKMYPGQVVPCDTFMFAQLMMYKPMTPLESFKLDIKAMPRRPFLTAIPRHSVLTNLLLDYFPGTSMIFMYKFRRNMYAAMLPDGPIAGCIDAVTSAMSSCYTKIGHVHPGGKEIVPAGTFKDFDNEMSAGQLLTEIMMQSTGIVWETVGPKD